MTGKKKCMSFAIPMMWREPTNHHSNYYFCLVNVQGHNRKSKRKSPSAIMPVPHGKDLPVPLPLAVLENIAEDDVEGDEISTEDDIEGDDVYRPTDSEKAMNAREKVAWTTFRSVTENFLGNNKDPNYKNIVETMLENFKKLGCNMNVKVHFLHSHIEYFPENLGRFSEEQGERFHQDIK
jgi:hypothetical protein